jgi:uncharacterized RDD family membrane protein YckC
MRFFKHITLRTPESVELEFTLAGIGSRAFALIIDYHILVLVLLTFWVLWVIVAIQLMNYLTQLPGDYSSLPGWLLAIAVFSNFVIYSGYFVYFETVWQGQTPGKRIAKIRVIRDDGRPISLNQAVLRALLRFVDQSLLIGLFFILFGKQEKRIGDWVAGTLVIQEEQPLLKGGMTISREAQTLSGTLPNLCDLSVLLPDDIVILREYLQRRSTMAFDARRKLSLDLARQMKTLVKLETVPDGVTSDQFLEATYLAYQQDHGEEPPIVPEKFT